MASSIFKYTLIFVVLSCLLWKSFGNLPGIEFSREYQVGELLEVKTRKLYSKQNLPFDFYYLMFCRPNPRRAAAENLGEVIFGDRIENSLYTFKVLKPITCRKLVDYVDPTCTNDNQEGCVKAECPKLSKTDVEAFIEKIDENYEAQMIIDNLPVANIQQQSTGFEKKGPDPKLKIDSKAYSKPDGFPIGCQSDDGKMHFINNHLSFHIKYNTIDDNSKFSIVGAAVVPSSIKHDEGSCIDGKPIPHHLDKVELSPTNNSNNQIVWTYSVEWEESNVPWASRWDAYLSLDSSNSSESHRLLSIINSLVIVLFLSGIVAMIMMRTLMADISKYNDDADIVLESGGIEDNNVGWKILNGDVFRPPRFYALLSITVGSGVQLAIMAFIVIVFTAIGFMSPTNRVGIARLILVMYGSLGGIAGFVSIYLYKIFGGTRWKTVCILTAIYFPGITSVLFLGINLLIWIGTKSSLAVPFLSIVWIGLVWMCLSLPTTFLGGYVANHMEFPTKRFNIIQRPLPTALPWYLNNYLLPFLTGILPFASVFIELYFILSSIWLHRFYYFFGFLLLVVMILIITCSEMTIVIAYFQLSNQNWNWWWSAYNNAGGSAIYILLYSIFYYVTKLNNAASNIGMAVAYFGYMFIISFTFFVITGSIGFISCYWFIHKIYSSINKFD